ncbi:MAG: DUF1924 domain-containing protein [Polynucleobacter sp.]|nr:DUF1924 domain-containing protein [Polynucleobacter sp.]MDO8713723.1 DUF1924 domain-containing protein [Polynucleobacter sp.]
MKSTFAAIFSLIILTLTGNTLAADPQSFLKLYAAEAKEAPSAQKGGKFFSEKHGNEWSCSSCHGMPPIGEGKHASTNKVIAPLAPAFNAERFTDDAKVEKWFKRNCNDVVGRSCTASEKSDVLAYLISLKK